MGVIVYAVPKKKLAINESRGGFWKISFGYTRKKLNELNPLSLLETTEGKQVSVTDLYYFDTLEAALKYQDWSHCDKAADKALTYVSPIVAIEVLPYCLNSHPEYVLTLDPSSDTVNATKVQADNKETRYVLTLDSSSNTVNAKEVQADNNETSSLLAKTFTIDDSYSILGVQIGQTVFEVPVTEELRACKALGKRLNTYQEYCKAQIKDIQDWGFTVANTILDEYVGDQIVRVADLKTILAKKDTIDNEHLAKEFYLKIRQEIALALKNPRKNETKKQDKLDGKVNLEGTYFGILLFLNQLLSTSFVRVFGTEKRMQLQKEYKAFLDKLYPHPELDTDSDSNSDSEDDKPPKKGGESKIEEEIDELGSAPQDKPISAPTTAPLTTPESSLSREEDQSTTTQSQTSSQTGNGGVDTAGLLTALASDPASASLATTGTEEIPAEPKSDVTSTAGATTSEIPAEDNPGSAPTANPEVTQPSTLDQALNTDLPPDADDANNEEKVVLN
jgi:hypothetical protein